MKSMTGSEEWKRVLMRVRIVAALILAGISLPAHSIYNANMDGIVEMVAIYADGDYIYVRLVNQPTTHPVCNPAYFVIPQDVPENRRNQMFARLMAAKYAGESINLGYDNSTECMHGFIRLHRVG